MAAVARSREATRRRKLRSAAVALLSTMLTACAPAPPAKCTPDFNAAFQQDVMERRRVVEGVGVCGVVSGLPYESSGEHGLHVYIPVRVQAPGGASYVTQVIPNEVLDGRITVHQGDSIVAVGQFVYPNYRFGYEGLIHDTHPATHRGGADGYVEINGKLYR